MPASPLARLQRGAEDVFAQDHGDRRRGGRFRWFVSTCFAAGIGAFAILLALIGTNEDADPTRLAGQAVAALATAPNLPAPAQPQGLTWSLPKGDKLVTTSGAISIKFIIPDQIRQLRDNRNYLQKKTYARIVGHLAAVAPPAEDDAIPTFNPYTLYTNNGSGNTVDALADVELQDGHANTIELLGGILPDDDGQEMKLPEVADEVARDAARNDEITLKPGFGAAGAEKLTGPQLLEKRAQRIPETLPPNTTALAKSTTAEADDSDDLEAREVKTLRVSRGDDLGKILEKLNAEAWQAGEINLVAKTTLGEDLVLSPGQELQVVLVPSLTKAGAKDVVRVSFFGSNREHRLTVALKPDGDFAGSTTPIEDRAGKGSRDKSTVSLYTGLYVAASKQGLSPDTIQQILRIHASDTDFRRRARALDDFELFFDIKEEDKGTDGALGDLLASSFTIGGETQKYYRFRTPDGQVDFYDQYGNNSRKFLMRKPVRGEVRMADGFGWRRHPLLHILRRHAGIDWAGATGTPIMAAGAGVVEEAKHHAEYGNYIRIRHANGYSTAYGHMQRFAQGMTAGTRVTQGQVIGYIGQTGLATGPHLHFEVLINSQQIDPMKMPVPQEKKLEGRDLAEFQKERVRIDELIRRNPVSTKIIEAQAGK